jgi:hypothetical protein
MWSQKYSRLWCIKDYHPSLLLYIPVDYIISTCEHRNTVDYDVLKIISQQVEIAVAKDDNL